MKKLFPISLILAAATLLSIAAFNPIVPSYTVGSGSDMSTNSFSMTNFVPVFDQVYTNGATRGMIIIDASATGSLSTQGKIILHVIQPGQPEDASAGVGSTHETTAGNTVDASCSRVLQPNAIWWVENNSDPAALNTLINCQWSNW